MLNDLGQFDPVILLKVSLTWSDWLAKTIIQTFSGIADSIDVHVKLEPVNQEEPIEPMIQNISGSPPLQTVTKAERSESGVEGEESQNSEGWCTAVVFYYLFTWLIITFSIYNIIHFTFLLFRTKGTWQWQLCWIWTWYTNNQTIS